MVFYRTCFGNIGRRHEDDAEEKVEVVDSDAVHLSYIGKAAYEVLRTEHGTQHNVLWNATLGTLVQNTLDQTPPHETLSSDEASDPTSKHSDWFPEKLGDILSRTEVWADVMSLGPPGMCRCIYNLCMINSCMRQCLFPISFFFFLNGFDLFLFHQQNIESKNMGPS